MPRYRLVFPPPPGVVASNSRTATIDSAEVLGVGSIVEHDGRLWSVGQAPVSEPEYGATADLLVWPAPAVAD